MGLDRGIWLLSKCVRSGCAGGLKSFGTGLQSNPLSSRTGASVIVLDLKHCISLRCQTVSLHLNHLTMFQAEFMECAVIR